MRDSNRRMISYLYSFYQCLEKHFGSEFFTELREAERKFLECSKALPDAVEIEPIRIDTGTVKGGEVASFIEELYSLRERSKVR